MWLTPLPILVRALLQLLLLCLQSLILCSQLQMLLPLARVEHPTWDLTAAGSIATEEEWESFPRPAKTTGSTILVSATHLAHPAIPRLWERSATMSVHLERFLHPDSASSHLVLSEVALLPLLV